MELVSVIIPSYNHSIYIKEAVESVLDQTYKKIELIVVDDGSSDGSLAYLSTVTDPRFVLIKQKNRGAHIAINNGIKKSKGKFIAILNSDDIYHKDRIKKTIAKFDKDTGMICSWINVIDENGKRLGIKKGWENMLPWDIDKRSLSKSRQKQFNINLILSNFISTTSNVIFTRRVFNRIGGFKNLRFTHDWDFFLRVALSFECKIIPEALVSYRIHSKNTISSNRKWMLYEICLIYAIHLKKLFLVSKASFQEMICITNSINTQGNNHVLFALSLYFESISSKKEIYNLDSLLKNDNLRNSLAQHLKV